MVSTHGRGGKGLGVVSTMVEGARGSVNTW